MKTMLRIFLFVALFFAWSGATSAQKLLHSAVYYDTGTSFDGSQWMQNTPVGSAYFQIYDNYVYFGETKYVSQGYVNLYGFYGKKYVKEGTGGAQFIVVSNNFDIINCLTLTFWGSTHTTAGVWSKVPPSNQAQSQTNTTNGSTNSTTSQSSTLKKVTCTLCHGTGRHGKEYAPKYSYSKPDTWCPTCQKFDYIHHHEVKCPACAGRGWNYSNY